MDLLIKLYKIT